MVLFMTFVGLVFLKPMLKCRKISFQFEVLNNRQNMSTYQFLRHFQGRLLILLGKRHIIHSEVTMYMPFRDIAQTVRGARVAQ